MVSVTGRTPVRCMECPHISVLTPEAARRLERVLTADPGTGIVRHADAGYEEAINFAARQGIHVPHVARPSTHRKEPTATPLESGLPRAAPRLPPAGAKSAYEQARAVYRGDLLAMASAGGEADVVGSKAAGLHGRAGAGYRTVAVVDNGPAVIAALAEADEMKPGRGSDAERPLLGVPIAVNGPGPRLINPPGRIAGAPKPVSGVPDVPVAPKPASRSPMFPVETARMQGRITACCTLSCAVRPALYRDTTISRIRWQDVPAMRTSERRARLRSPSAVKAIGPTSVCNALCFRRAAMTSERDGKPPSSSYADSIARVRYCVAA